MSAIAQRKNPTLAEIVRQETDGGRTIVQFYIRVADGTLDGFRDHHRMAAARRLDKIAPDLVREYLHKFHNAQVRESMRGSLFPMGRMESMEKPGRCEPVPRGPNRFQRRLAQLVRKETGDGRTIFNFLNGVMHGTLTGFQPYHRLEASRELSNCLTLTPSPSTGEGRGQGDSPVVPANANGNPDNTIVVPAKAGTQGRGGVPSSPSPSTEEGRGEGDSPVSVRPELVEEPTPYSIRGQFSAEQPPSTPTKNQKPTTRNFPPITHEELEQNNFDPTHIARYNFARDEITGSIFAFDHKSPIVMDDDGTLCRVAPDYVVGYERAVEEHDRAPDTAHTRPSGRSGRTRNRRRKNPNTPTRRLKSGARHSSPGRSPPKIWV